MYFFTKIHYLYRLELYVIIKEQGRSFCVERYMAEVGMYSDLAP